MKQRLKFRIYPTNSQKTALAQMFGCSRVVWNDALAYCQASYANGKKYCGFPELSKRFLTETKNYTKLLPHQGLYSDRANH